MIDKFLRIDNNRCTHNEAKKLLYINHGIWIEIFIDDNGTFGYLITRFENGCRIDCPITRNYQSPYDATEGALNHVVTRLIS